MWLYIIVYLALNFASWLAVPQAGHPSQLQLWLAQGEEFSYQVLTICGLKTRHRSTKYQEDVPVHYAEKTFNQPLADFLVFPTITVTVTSTPAPTTAPSAREKLFDGFTDWLIHSSTNNYPDFSPGEWGDDEDWVDSNDGLPGWLLPVLGYIVLIPVFAWIVRPSGTTSKHPSQSTSKRQLPTAPKFVFKDPAACRAAKFNLRPSSPASSPESSAPSSPTLPPSPSAQLLDGEASVAATASPLLPAFDATSPPSPIADDLTPLPDQSKNAFTDRHVAASGRRWSY